MDELEQWLEKVYASGGDRETLEHLYDEWAKDYDQQLWASGNPYIAVSAGMAGRHIPAYDAVILDAGCGTGNMAQVLHQIGFENLEGLEPSAGMLAVAERKGIYKALHQLALGGAGRFAAGELRRGGGIGRPHSRSRPTGIHRWHLEAREAARRSHLLFIGDRL